jgi:hypothetical protein
MSISYRITFCRIEVHTLQRDRRVTRGGQILGRLRRLLLDRMEGRTGPGSYVRLS